MSSGASAFRILIFGSLLVLGDVPLSGQTAPKVAEYQGCPVFAPDDYYNQIVSNAPVDANSSKYIAATITAGNTGGFWAGANPVEYINIATHRTKRVAVKQKVPYHRFPVPYPWEASFRIEPLSDRHALILDTNECRIFELYGTSYTDGVLSAYSGATWDLRQPFSGLPPGEPSAMASGLSMFAGLIRWEDVASGRIDHTLNWAPPAGTVAQYAFVRPASDTDGIAFNGSSPYQLPYGARLRLHSNFDTSHFGPQSRAIADAMKTYGVVLSDTGSKDNTLFTANSLSGDNHWDASDLANLNSIHISDFDVLKIGTILRVRK
jgi:hypothetical protein